MSFTLPVAALGSGPPILFIHGSATDRGAWVLQLNSMSRDFRVIAYDRRGTVGAPLVAGERPTTIDHAIDAAQLLESEARGPALVVGSSYGAVVALELAVRSPALVAGLVLCEPPLAVGESPRIPFGYGCALYDLAARSGGEAAAELFIRSVLGDAGFAAMPKSVRTRALSTWPQIASDGRGLTSWVLPRAALAALPMPILLVGGDRSPSRFGDALDALELLLPRPGRLTVRDAGHNVQVDQARAFERAVREHAARCGLIPKPRA